VVCLNLLIPQPALHDQVDVRKVAFKESKFRLLWHSSDVLLNSELLPSSIDCIPRPHQASSLSDFGHTGLQADAAASLLAESLAPVEWAVCRHVLGVFRAALQEGPTNGLSSAALAALLADAWFGTSPHSYGAAGANLTEQQISELQRISASVVTLCERRAAFIQLFLDTAEPRHD